MGIGRAAALIAALAAAGCASPAAIAPTPTPRSECELSAGDKAWLDRSIAAWNHTRTSLTRVSPPAMTALIFDAACVLSGADALTDRPGHWIGRRHSGKVALPDGQSVPAGVTAFAANEGGTAFFVMAAPAIWRSAGVEGGVLGLDNLMTAVLLHEATHIVQISTFGERMTRLSVAHDLGNDFNDDSIQAMFGEQPGYAEAVNREITQFLAAAAAPNREEARRLAAQGMALVRQRQASWFGEGSRHLGAAEDIWLTLEGSGQWVGYRWLIDPRGAGLSPAVALPAFGMRGKSWSQKQGLAMMLALERISDRDWRRHLFVAGDSTLGELLEASITNHAIH